MPTNHDHSAWMTGMAYRRGDQVTYDDGRRYTCLPSHRSQSDWTPGVAQSLWLRNDQAYPGA